MDRKKLLLTNKIEEHLNGQDAVFYVKLNQEIKLSGGIKSFPLIKIVYFSWYKMELA